MKHEIAKRALVKRLRDTNRLPAEYRYGADSHQGAVDQRAKAPRSGASYRSIMVPLDCSPFAEHALPVALGIAKLTGAHIRLVHMQTRMESLHGTNRPQFASSFEEQVHREEVDYLCAMARRIERMFSVRVISNLIEAENIGESLAYIGNAMADLVVMATHGRGRIGNWIWDSVANQLVNRARVPHLLVRGHNSRADLSKTSSLKHIVIPLDGSKAAEAALGPAATFASANQSDCTLLRVLEPEDRARTPSKGYSQGSQYLQTVGKSLMECEGVIRTSVIRQEKSIAASILAQSNDLNADVIALTSRVRSPLGRLFRPSMVEQLLHKGSVPILVCPQKAPDPQITVDGKPSC